MHVALMKGGGNPDGVDKRLQQVVENHCPSGKKAEVRIQAFANVSVGRSRGRVEGTHASVADCRDQHGEESDENDGDEMAVGKLLRNAVERHGRDRLDEDDTVEDQVPEGESAAKSRDG